MQKLVPLLTATLALSSMLAAAKREDRPETLQELLEQKLLHRIRVIDRSLTGALGVAIIDLNANRTVAWHGDSVFPQASSIKIPIMVEVFRSAREGRVKLENEITLQPTDAVGGSGHLRILLRRGPLKLTVSDLVTAMIETSDNTATNRLIAMVGMDRVNATMERLGFGNTRLRRIMLDSEAAGRGHENVSTPLEMARLVELIYRGKAVDAEASRQMLDTMKLVEADFRAAVPSGVPVASKPGEITGVRCETGVILVKDRPFVLSVMSTYLDDGVNPVGQVARIVYEHFARLAVSNAYGNRFR